MAAKLVETFLDPFDNPLADRRLAWDNVLKQDIADKIYGLPDDVLNQFAIAYRSPSVGALTDSMKLAAAALSLRSQSALADSVQGVRPRLPRIVDLLRNTTAIAPLNVTVFIDFMTIVEMLGRWPGVGPTTIVHDSILEFEKLYEALLAHYRDSEPFDVTLPSGTIVTAGFESLTGFQAISSDESPLVQAADILAGTIASYTKAVTSEERPLEGIVEQTSIILATFFSTKPKLCSVIGSRQFLVRLFGFVLKETRLGSSR